jgi:hypothetical protein
LGGRVLRAIVGGSEGSTLVVATGVGHGSIDVLGAGDDEWLVLPDRADHPLLLPLHADTPSSIPSAEDGLEGGRIVAFTRPSSPTASPAASFVVAFPGSDGPLLRHAVCATVAR